MSRKRTAFIGFFADAGGMFFIQALSLVAIPFYLQYFSNSDYGYWIIISSVIGWLGLADFGIGTAISRFFLKAVSSFRKEQNSDQVNKVASSSLMLFILIATLLLIIGFSLSTFLPVWFNVEAEKVWLFLVSFLIVVVSTALNIPFAIFGAMLEAQQKIVINRNIQTIGALFQLMVSVLLVIFLKSIVALAIGLFLGSLFTGLLLLIYSRKYMTLRFSQSHVSKSELKNLLSFGGLFQLGKTANIIATSTDSLFIAHYFDASRVAVYNFTAKLPLLFCITIASKIPAALFSGLSQLFDEEKFELFQKAFLKLFSIIIRLAFFAAILIFFINGKFVNLWFGKNSYGGNTLNLIFVYWVFFETIIRGTGIVFQIFSELKTWAYAAVMEAILNISLSFYFLHIGWGLPGLAMATAIARTCTIGIYWVWFLNHKQLVSYKLFIDHFLGNAIKNIPMLIVLYILSKFVLVNNVIEIVVYCILAAFINLLSYDWHIIITAGKRGSMKDLLQLYAGKYLH